MDAPSVAHPSHQTLQSFGLGKLDDASAEAIDKHLEQCPDCRNWVAEMSADSFLGRIRAARAEGMSAFGQSRSQGKRSYTGPTASPPPRAGTLPPDLADYPDYEIKRELGRGGMGVVYLAHNKLMGRDEVLKVLARHIMERPGVLDRFLRENRAVAMFRHPKGQGRILPNDGIEALTNSYGIPTVVINNGASGPNQPASAQALEQEPLPEAEQLGRMILGDPELRSAFEHLKTALTDADLKGAVLRTLETFAHQAGRSHTIPDRD